VHLGTAEVLARVAQVRSIAPGEMGFARLLLEQPIVARGGDRFVVRSFSPGDDDWGGLVLDPFPPKRLGWPSGDSRCSSPAASASRASWRKAGLRGAPVRDVPVRVASCQERSPRPSNKPGRV